MNRKSLVAVALLTAISSSSAILAADQVFGSFRLPASAPDTIQMRGDFTAGTAAGFMRALRARPGATLLDLASNGGDILDVGIESSRPIPF